MKTTEFLSKYVPGDLVPNEDLLYYLELDTKEPNIKDFTDTKTYRAQLDKYNFEYLSKLAGFQEVLLTDHKRNFINKRGKGYLIQLASDQSEWAYNECIKDIKKTFLKARKIAKNIELSDLTSQQKVQASENEAKIGNLNAMFSGEVKRLESLKKLSV